MKKIILMIAVLLAAPVFIIRSYGEEPVSELDIRTISGTAVNVDSVGRKIAVQSFNEVFSFNVPENTKIIRTNEEIMLDDVDQGDSVTVDYHRTSSGALETVIITDNNVAYE